MQMLHDNIILLIVVIDLMQRHDPRLLISAEHGAENC